MISRFKSMDVEPLSDTHMTDWRCHEPRNHIEILGIGDFVQPVRAAHQFYIDALRLNRCQVVNQIITRLFECVRRVVQCGFISVLGGRPGASPTTSARACWGALTMRRFGLVRRSGRLSVA